ncbi:MAG: lyase [Myxococcales bacterium]|nr:lyase [Myxococcales bacterium]
MTVTMDPSTGPSLPTTAGPGTDTGTTAGGVSMGHTDTTNTPTTAGPTGDPTGTEPTSAPTTMTGTEPGTGTTMPVIETSSGGTSTSTGPASTGDTGTTAAPDTGSSETTAEPVCEPGQGMGMGMVEKSFIWIASQDLSDISKVNTQTMVELARYRTGPSNNESPSRTAVSADGRFVVVNDRQTGRSTMIAANVEDCVDKNGNGMIDTSLSKNDIRAWGQDECVLWSIAWPYKGAWQHGPRGVTWTLGTWDYDLCKYVEPKVWIGYMSNDPGGTTVHLVRVDGASGTVEQTIKVPNWIGQDFAPYGAALDPQFRPWFSSLQGEFVRVNTDQNPITVTRYTPPGYVQSYGFTVDSDGNPWFAGYAGPVTMFDVASNTYIPIPNTSGVRRGIAVDDKYVWAAANSPCGLLQIDRVNKTLIQFHTPNPCNTAIGLSIDAEDFVWLVDQGGWAWKFDGDNVPAMMKVDILGSHYVYSDMTGGQLLSIVPQ